MFQRFFTFWPFILISIVFSLLSAFLYLRYTDYLYESSAVIEVIDKANDSEMALPTSMTIFNRSMINLENEFGRLNSYDLNKEVVSKLKSNIKFYSVGKIKKSIEHKDDFFEDYKIEYKINTDTIVLPSSYFIKIFEKTMNISVFDENDDYVEEYSFNNLTTKDIKHKLPFELTINKTGNEYSTDVIIEKEIKFTNFRNTVETFINLIKTNQFSSGSKMNTYAGGSDQIKLTIQYISPRIAEEYLDNLIFDFDFDGIKERQSEYKRTIDFVENRSAILQKEVEIIENRKKEFKKDNRLTDIQSDANLNINKQFEYNTELFNLQSQLDLVNLLKIELDSSEYNLLPSNFGLNNLSLNESIIQFNALIKEKSRLTSYGAGSNNTYLKNINMQIGDFYQNIIQSVNNYEESLRINISKIVKKEKEFENFYLDIPEKEKILREIERELNVKEALYSLLLQKKEEASINFAVVKPTIKLIDSPRSSVQAVNPNPSITYVVFLIIGLISPFFIISLIFYLDNKVHVKDDITYLNIPIIAEVPYSLEGAIKNFVDISGNDRSVLTESFRMAKSNSQYSLSNDEKSKVILITSSIKGEGKTVVSSNFAKVLSNQKKTILIGSDLRNPQIHKFLNMEKNALGVSDIIYRNDLNWRDTVVKSDKLDIILSGVIPPNPTELLSSEKFKKLISDLKNEYDYVVIDSAPCLLVADTFEFANLADLTLLVIRSNHTPKEILSYVDDLVKNKRLKNVNLLLNGVGNSKSYGYKYNYQYGYKYNYQYGYNYGYGYGYSEEKS